MLELLIGAVAAFVLFYLYNYTRSHEISIPWWGWLLSVLGILFAVFTIEVIIGFLSEGAPQAALVVGFILVVIAAIWGVLLGRFVFKKAAAR